VYPEIHVGPIGGTRLVDDYVAGRQAAVRFFGSAPGDPLAFTRKAAEVDGRLTPGMRVRVTDAITASSDRAASKLERVLAGDGYVVTTGQQPGLLLGPLYTTHKLLSCIRLAAELEAHLDRPVAPLFWIASDDHDWAEANHVHLVSAGNDLIRLALGGEAEDPPRGLRYRKLGPDAAGMLEELEAALPPSEFADRVVRDVRGSYHPGRPVAEAYRDLLLRWFGDLDFLVVDAGHPDVKVHSREVLAAELRQHARHEASLLERTRALESAGYHAQVPILPGAANVFLDSPAGRDRLVAEDGTWHLRHSGERFETGALEALLGAEPERFSPNVLLRPIVESHLLPTLAYVAGPGEVAYLAQTEPLFRSHGVDMPVVVPRRSVLLVEGKVRKVLDKFHLEPAAVRRPIHELAADVLQDEVPEEIRDTVAGLRHAIEEGYQRLEGPVTAIDATLERPLRSARNESLAPLHDVERRIMQHLKQRNATGLQQLEKARTNLFPGGVPQERVLSLVQYLVRYGPGLPGAILESLALLPAAGGVAGDGTDGGSPRGEVVSSPC
jgi:bacillithiol synthase